MLLNQMSRWLTHVVHVALYWLTGVRILTWCQSGQDNRVEVQSAKWAIIQREKQNRELEKKIQEGVPVLHDHPVKQQARGRQNFKATHMRRLEGKRCLLYVYL